VRLITGWSSITTGCAGRVFDALRRTRFAENTVVVYTSDHGDMAGEHRL